MSANFYIKTKPHFLPISSLLPNIQPLNPFDKSILRYATDFHLSPATTMESHRPRSDTPPPSPPACEKIDIPTLLNLIQATTGLTVSENEIWSALSSMLYERSLDVVLPRFEKFFPEQGLLRPSPDDDTWAYTWSSNAPATDQINETEVNEVLPTVNDDSPNTNLTRIVFREIPKTLEISEQMLLYLGVPKEEAKGMLVNLPQDLEHLLQFLKDHGINSDAFRPGKRGLAIAKITGLPWVLAERLSPPALEKMAQNDDGIRLGPNSKPYKGSCDGAPKDRVFLMLEARSWALCDAASLSEACGPLHIQCELQGENSVWKLGELLGDFLDGVLDDLRGDQPVDTLDELLGAFLSQVRDAVQGERDDEPATTTEESAVTTKEPATTTEEPTTTTTDTREE
ncbi:hypothetical protein B0J18DRAFT_406350 [Chaetomium sp. MPI-SDFR-AT-0129]|nr:hypothetical protein B0J18DRAFT_406350 [Chaetomium sp. MPI-SDFR-AT-0129]